MISRRLARRSGWRHGNGRSCARVDQASGVPMPRSTNHTRHRSSYLPPRTDLTGPPPVMSQRRASGRCGRGVSANYENTPYVAAAASQGWLADRLVGSHLIGAGGRREPVLGIERACVVPGSGADCSDSQVAGAGGERGGSGIGDDAEDDLARLGHDEVAGGGARAGARACAGLPDRPAGGQAGDGVDRDQAQPFAVG
jgi:hypothetical protein